MPHILIYDENGNEIGRSNEGHEGEGGLAADDHEPEVVTLNISKIIDLHGINTNQGKAEE